MRKTIRTLAALACLGLLTAPALAQRTPNLLPSCGPFDVLDAATSIFPPSQYDADPGCDVETAPLPGCGGEDLVIADQAALESFWDKHKPWTSPPEVDFDDKIVVANFTGWRRTGGYGPVVTCVRYYESSLIPRAITSVRVEVRDVSPGPQCFVTQAFTNPYSIIAVDRPSHHPAFPPNVTFVHEDFVASCSTGGGQTCPCGVCNAGGGGGGVGQAMCCPCT